MGLLDFIVGRHMDDYITIGFVIFLVIAGLTLAGFNVSGAIANFESIARYLVGFAAGAAGVYVLYKTERSRSPADDFLGAVIGLGLIAFGAGIAFGGDIIAQVSKAGDTLKGLMPYLIAGSMALGGVKLASMKDKASETMGIILIIGAVIVLILAQTGFNVSLFR